MEKKEYRIYQTDFDEYSLETIQTTYFYGRRLGDAFYSIDKLTQDQLYKIMYILELNGYKDTTDTAEDTDTE